MIRLVIPGASELLLSHAVFDLNGTLAVDGKLVDGVAPRLSALSEHLECILASADTNQSLAATAQVLRVEARRVDCGSDKASLLAELRRTGALGIVAVGNGRNDAEMFRSCTLAIAVVGAEGASGEALLEADVVCTSPVDALDLLLHPLRLVSTLRP